ncbi:NAD(P)-binding protein [Bimuria novae-zelandiae CBS 107.79]|uniref:NAD(P)-binding protein n=1 Tax=Bimuria novae-zelandiae CBS 107.79 TaxID=1447943 RepID=A0A6A5VGR2_9PLEO|nr:NAD(P)-binding protein [Bimuria novae-zelandiae CBS 107.79]
MHRIVAITGASSGLGLAFVKHYAAQPSTRIFALDISPLPDAVSSLENVSYYEVDVMSEESFKGVLEALTNLPIHILIHSAGVRGLAPPTSSHQDVAALEALAATTHATFTRTFEINTWGALLTIRTLIPHLQLASTPDSSHPDPPKVIVMSSRMGSVSANTSGGGYAYRASKAALNAVAKSLSVDVPGVVVLALHPGRVETGLVEWKDEGAMSVEESLGTCLMVIEGVGLRDTGRFLNRFGAVIGW